MCNWKAVNVKAIHGDQEGFCFLSHSTAQAKHFIGCLEVYLRPDTIVMAQQVNLKAVRVDLTQTHALVRDLECQSNLRGVEPRMAMRKHGCRNINKRGG